MSTYYGVPATYTTTDDGIVCTLPDGHDDYGYAPGSTFYLSPAEAADNSDAVAWCRSGCECGAQRGSATRAQMRAYALAVANALTGSASCVHCGAGVSLHSGEVDRTLPGCYRPCAVILTCGACNNGLGQVGGVAFDRDRYARDVARVSFGMPIPSPSASLRAYRADADVYATIRRSPYWTA